jgi:uncharacterized protein
MICPNCNIQMLPSEIHGEEIDYCPKCMGIWLENGKIELIIETLAIRNTQKHRFESKHYDNHDHDHYNHHNDRDKDHDQYDNKYGKERKRNFLSDLFDF